MKSKNKCLTKYCRNDKVKGRNYCSKCNMRHFRENNPIHYYYHILKSNARKRHKEFLLTVEEFEKFCKETNYIEIKGKTKNSYSIDRKDDSKGYTYDNIRILSLSENSKKENDRRKNECPF